MQWAFAAIRNVRVAFSILYFVLYTHSFFSVDISGSGSGNFSGSGSGSGSGVPSICIDGDIRGEQITQNLSSINERGEIQSNTELLLTACVQNTFGGVCRRGADNEDANVACRYLGYGKYYIIRECFSESLFGFRGRISGTKPDQQLHWTYIHPRCQLHWL